MNSSKATTIQENFDNFGNLKSRFDLIEKEDEKEKDKCLIAKHWCVLSTVGLTMVALFLAAALALYFSPRPAYYKESCASRSCYSALNLKCINKTCLCTTDQYYSNKCEDKKNYLEKCGSLTSHCKSNMNLVCKDGICKCSDNYYWNGAKCVLKVEYSKSCTSDEQCYGDKMITCDSSKQRCTCNSERFFDGNACPIKRIYYEYCKDNTYCNDAKYLICKNNLCVCNSTQYWDYIFYLCLTKKYEFEECISNLQCYSPMSCSNGICLCGTNMYFDRIAMTCYNQKLINKTCLSNIQCRGDLGLDCINGMCQCNTTGYKWSNERTMCILPKTYTEQTCIYNSDCYVENGLICNVGQLCNCPDASSVGMCDCIRNVSKEYFWNSTQCILANTNGYYCSGTYMCKWMTEGLECNNNICQCPQYMYFDSTANVCKNQTSINTGCTSSISCRSDQGLMCISNQCVCNSSIQYWSNTNSKCLNYFNYTQSGCVSSTECFPSLICNNVTNNKCNCPVVNLIQNTCDCPRWYGYEYYWNGQMCTVALSYNSACSNSSTSYMCKTITQNTVCSLLSGSFVCTCDQYNYFDTATNTCKNQTSINTTCTSSISCRSDLGLVCINNLCSCNSSQFWLSTGCRNIYKYGESGCTDNSQCASTLICNTASTSCNCPLSLTSGTCDCPRTYNNEYYWNNIQCVPANSYNQQCSISSIATNYTCQTITQETYCDPTTKKCVCGPTGGFNTALNKCTYCGTNWWVYGGKCVSISSTAGPSDNNFLLFNSSTVNAPCNNASSSFSLFNDINLVNFIRSITANSGEYWIGYRTPYSSSSCPGSNFPTEAFTSNDGKYNLSNPIVNWCPTYPVGKLGGGSCTNCVAYNSANNCLRNEVCTNNFKIICEVG